MSTCSVRHLVLILAFTLAACASPGPSPTTQPQAPAAPATQAAAPAATSAAKAPATPAAKPPAAPTAKPAPVSINFAYPVVSSLYWHLFIGEEKGQFADEGIDFKRTFVSTGVPAVAQGLVAGAYQLASVSADVGVSAAQNGADVVYVGSEMHMPVFSIAAQPDIKSFADIKNNARVGSGAVRGGTATLLRLLLMSHGLKEGAEFSMVAVGTTGERVGALRNRSIEIGLLGQPQDFMMQEEGFTVLGQTSDMFTDWGMAEILVRRDWVKANEDVAVRYLRANARIIDWLYDPKNKGEAIQILVKATKVEEKYALKTYELLIEKLKAFVPKGEPSEKAIDATIKILTDAGELQGVTPKGATLVDRSYWQKAMESLKGR